MFNPIIYLLNILQHNKIMENCATNKNGVLKVHLILIDTDLFTNMYLLVCIPKFTINSNGIYKNVNSGYSQGIFSRIDFIVRPQNNSQ